MSLGLLTNGVIDAAVAMTVVAAIAVAAMEGWVVDWIRVDYLESRGVPGRVHVCGQRRSLSALGSMAGSESLRGTLLTYLVMERSHVSLSRGSLWRLRERCGRKFLVGRLCGGEFGTERRADMARAFLGLSSHSHVDMSCDLKSGRRTGHHGGCCCGSPVGGRWC